ncbi:MAG: TolC family protein [Carboxylicivirga sp.]|jgi:outer membrane protein TolC|nr:TolC family protein [Carboxylicivirga sp.]
MNKAIILVGLLLVSVAISAQNHGATANDELVMLVEAALAHNKQLKNQRLELEKTDITKHQVYNTYLPRIEATGTYSYSKGKLNMDTEPIPFTTPPITLPIQIPNMPPLTMPSMQLAIPGIDKSFDYNGNLWMGGLMAKWTLFTGLKVPYLGKALKHKIKAGEYMIEQSEANIIEDLTSYYDKIALLAQAQKVLAESEKRLGREAKVAQRALNEGLITQHDYQKIEIARLDLSSRQIELRGNEKLLQLKLYQLTGLPMDSIINIRVKMKPLKGINNQSSYLERPEIKALDEAIIASEYKLKSETSGYLPKVQAFATHSYAGFKNGETGPLTFNELSAYPINAVGVGFKWELFDGFHTHEERKKAKIQIQQTQNKRADAAELLMLNYNKAINDYQVTSAQEALRAKQQDVSKRSLLISYKEYQNGIIKVSEFLEAQTDYEKAVFDYYQTVYNQRQSAVRLLNATGELKLERLRELY